MFNSIIKSKIMCLGLLLLSMLMLSSCLPSQTPSVQTNAQNGSDSETPVPQPGEQVFNQPTFPHNQNFAQESSTTTVNSLSLSLNFNDSFLLRGSAISNYLSKISTNTVMCLVGRYTYTPGLNRYLLLTAKPMVFTDVVKKTREYYLQVQPANDVANQNDCLTYNLQSVLKDDTSSLHFSFAQICTNCSNSVSSTPLKLYFATGEEASAINLANLRLVISSNNGNSGSSCVSNSHCQSVGYNCCIDSQCVNNGSIRPSAYDLPGFLSAQEEVRLTPDNFRKYPEFYFVCSDQSGTNPIPEPELPDVDYEAIIRLREQKHIYDCLNLVDGEFSHCTVKFPNASKRVNKIFSSADFNQKSDINFSTINPNFKTDKYSNNIFSVLYSNESLYNQDEDVSPRGGSFQTSNDDLLSAQSFTLTQPLATNAKDDDLYLTYKIDGTCTKINNNLAQCTKTYIYQSDVSDKYKTTYHVGGNTFRLPLYADNTANATVKVEISGRIIPEENTTWSRSSTTETNNGVTRLVPTIVFSGGYRIYQNQNVKITYYVRSNISALMDMKEDAQAKVNKMCLCTGGKCNLTPKYADNDSQNIVGYDCFYPPNDVNDPPTNQTVYISNKNSPHRYYDLNGVNYDENYDAAPAQEGRPFQYTNNNILNPNNNCKTGSCFVGFNEIYGSFDSKSTSRAHPAKRVRVKKDTTYDLITINGIFSTCVSCGTDYYNTLQRVFPNSFDNFGSGYTPDLLNNSRLNSTSTYRSDDLLFGRACFVPATMIPWTHTLQPNTRNQRVNRLNAQHALFSNGYQRDWFGFDYGSLIGSFDGATWFSIGSSRRIKAKGNYLYLAVNSYFNDLNTDNSYQLSVTEASPFSSPDKAEHDMDTDGAQCQKNHFCSNDNDCIRQVGYEYSCQNVNEIVTEWPVFDSTGAETIDSRITTIASIVGGTKGQARRCVYRGRGAPCVQNLQGIDTVNEDTIFNQSKTIGQIACSHNTACTPITASRFNTKVARFASTPTAQNLQEVSLTESDTVGLGARIIGRPFDYYGRSPLDSIQRSALAQTNINAICTPGKELSTSNTTLDLNKNSAANPYGKSDKLYGTGPTMSGLGSNWRSLSACPATDEAGQYLSHYNLGLTSTMLLPHSITQNMSSNLLDIPSVVEQKIFSVESSTLGDSKISTIGYQKNACLRAPGASCFSDLECSPSSLISDKFRSAPNLLSYLNQAEINFWKEDLICGNPQMKYFSSNILNTDFSILDNTCCRDMGKTLSVHTQTDSTDFKWCEGDQVQVAGLNTSVNDKDRYSRVHTIYDNMTCRLTDITSTKKFALSIAKGSAQYTDLNQILGQYKTLDTLNSRTCCTKNWVRSFHPTNGGGFKLDAGKMQRIDKSIFKYISWLPQDTTLDTPGNPIDVPFECDEENFTNVSCEIRSLGTNEQKDYLEWASSLELIGIPQVAIATNEKVHKLVDDNQVDISSSLEPLPKTIKDVGVVDGDFFDGSQRYYSAANYDKFDMSTNALKKVFSENEFNCCIPSGQEIPDSVGDGQCCTGFSATIEDSPKRCCLPDFTNVTVYLNRYVSSEGKGLADSAYDEKTGYIKDPATVVNMANEKSLCCSGTAMTGVAISRLPIPIKTGRYLPPNTANTVMRFNYRTDEVDNNSETGLVGSIFDAGVRWNNHVYCVPEEFNK